MKNQKTTKKALVSSVLSLALCLTMLIGTTFAWFTDSVTSAGNIIKSGKLDAELNYKSKLADNWQDASQGAIFDYDKWEPGYVDVKYVQVKNAGNLAFKYLINIIPEVAPIAGEKNLADVIDVYITKNPTEEIERADLTTMAKVGTLADMMAETDGAAHGVLLPKDGSGNATLAPEDAAIAEIEQVTLGIALKMQESAGNEYQELSVGEGFTVQLLATQYTWENDSFDNQYDAGLIPVEEGELLVEEDGIQYVYTDDGEKTLYLVPADYQEDTVNVPEGVTRIGNFSFAYNSNVKTVNLPSTVKTIDRAFDTSGVEVVELNEGLEVIGPRAFRKTPNLKTVEIPSTVKTIATNAFQQSGIEELTVPENVETIEFAGIAYCSKLKTLTIEGNPVIANYAARACANLTTVILLGDDVTFASDASMVFSNTEGGVSKNISILVENDTVAERVKAASTSCTGYNLAVKQSEGFYKDASANYYATTKEGLKSLNTYWQTNSMGNNMWGKTYHVSADIDATGMTWEGVYINIGSNANDGIVLDGNGYTISNMEITNGYMFSGTPNGADAGTKPGIVRDITFDNVTVSGNNHFNGIVWGNLTGELELNNVHVVNSNVSGKCNVGALVGSTGEFSDSATVKFVNCSVNNTVITANGASDADPTGANAFMGRAYAKTYIIFEGTNVSEGNTITNNGGLVGGGIYGYTIWDSSSATNWRGTGSCDTFTNWDGIE